MNIDELRALKKEEILNGERSLSGQQVDFLVKTLAEKDDTVRYNAFLLLQAESKKSALVYNHWSKLAEKIESDNSYQRSIGVMLLSENVQWDSKGMFNETIDRYLNCCSDEKFITARQAIQGLTKILSTTESYDQEIKQHLAILSFDKYKENQRKLLTKDREQALKILAKR